VKIGFENIKRASDVQAAKWKKTAEIRDKVFWLPECRPCQIHQELLGTFRSDAYSEDSV
jgi:hypothetical protein